MSDNKATANWAAAAERWLAEMDQTAKSARETVCDTAGMVQALCPRAQTVAKLLVSQDDHLYEALGDMRRWLRLWLPLDDHASSAAADKLDDHLAIERSLAAAIADLVDVVEPQRAEQLADRIAASVEASMHSILDDLPCHHRNPCQLRAAIDRLRDRAKFWQEHPGEEYDGQELAGVLMPIITQLLEHSQQGDAR